MPGIVLGTEDLEMKKTRMIPAFPWPKSLFYLESFILKIYINQQ